MALKLNRRDRINNLKEPKKTEVHNYRIPIVTLPRKKLTRLFDSRPEYELYDYPDIILSIIQSHKKINYEQIKTILKKHNVPCEHGQIIYGIDRLPEYIKVSKSSKTWTLRL